MCMAMLRSNSFWASLLGFAFSSTRTSLLVVPGSPGRLLARHEGGLRVQLDERGGLRCYGHGHDTSRRGAARALYALRLTPSAQNVASPLHITVGLHQGLLALHHARPRLLAE